MQQEEKHYFNLSISSFKNNKKLSKLFALKSSSNLSCSCGSLFIPGFNSSVKTVASISHVNSIVYTCYECSKSTFINGPDRLNRFNYDKQFKAYKVSTGSIVTGGGGTKVKEKHRKKNKANGLADLIKKSNEAAAQQKGFDFTDFLKK